jgi:hypothetical protein
MINLKINTKAPMLIVADDLPPAPPELIQAAADQLAKDVMFSIEACIVETMTLPPTLFMPATHQVVYEVEPPKSLVMWGAILNQPCLTGLRLVLSDELPSWGPAARRRRPHPRRILSRKQRIRQLRLARRWLTAMYALRALQPPPVSNSA